MFLGRFLGIVDGLGGSGGALLPFLGSLRVLREPSYGQKSVLQNIRIMVFLVFGAGARILLFPIFNLDSTQKAEPD